MRINNNIMAMNTHRQYGINNASIAKSTEKLSSGYRINRAGDDAAGLAISEKMRAQIRGLTMASKNSQDAISLIQTAEGALQESHNILQRMRELAVQSASDTNETSIDRNALNEEFQQLIKELDETARTTRFNDMGLIDGTYASNSTTASTTAQGVSSVYAAPKVEEGAYAVTFDAINTVAAVTGKAGSVKPGTDQIDGKANVIQSSDSATITLTYAAPQDVAANQSDSASGTWTFGWDDNKQMFTMTNSRTNEVLTAAPSNIAASSSITLDFGKAGKVTLTETAGEDLNFKNITGVSGGLTVELENAATARTAEYRHVATLNGETIDIENGMDTLVFNSGITVKLTSALSASGKNNATAEYTGTINIDVAKSQGKDFVVQTGANQGDELSVNIEKMNAASLGVHIASVATRLNASAAITQVNNAVNMVSTQRAALGALQNRLGHKIANLDTSAENLQAAESRIRDVDMAKEMTNFTRNNILFQASTAMLAQANAAPQGVLQLLG